MSANFAVDGYVHVPGQFSPAEVGRLRAAIERAPERDVGPNPLTLQTMRFASNLFYGSAELRALLSSAAVLGPVRQILNEDSWVRWDQAVWKGPGAPLFPWHQDNGYTELDAEHVQVWLALTEMNDANGGLMVVPGGHRSRLAHRWVGNHVQCYTTQEAALQGAISIDAQPGDLVIFSSFLPHATAPNTTADTRLAYVAEYLPCSVDDPSVPGPHFVPSAAAQDD